MTEWTDKLWVPVDRRLPEADDGLSLTGGSKVGVYVLTVAMVLNGQLAEASAFHLGSGKFDDADDEGGNRISFWAPCWDKSVLQDYGIDDAQQAPSINVTAESQSARR